MVRFVGGCIFGAALNFWSDAMLKRIRKYLERRAAITKLQSMTDRELKDIGLTRGEIYSVV